VYRLHRREFLTLAFSRTLCSTCKQPVKAQKRVRANLKVLLRKSSGFSFQAGLQARTASSTFYNPCTSYKPLMRLTTFFAFTRKHFRAPISRQLLVITTNCFCKLPAWGTLPRYEVTVTFPPCISLFWCFRSIDYKLADNWQSRYRFLSSPSLQHKV
jgi:hypothetical protein